nr:hypothetical protein [Salipiger sp. HF18]
MLAHGLTAWLITPVQALLLPDVTDFASLAYLPHGVRVLATWLLGPIAFVPLALGAFLSELMFTPSDVSQATQPVILLSIVAGAAASPLAFEMMRGFGFNLYARRPRRGHWKWLLLVGWIASFTNSLAQSTIFSQSILPGEAVTVLVIYAIGDLIGLVVTTLLLMMLFRRMRLSAARRS